MQDALDQEVAQFGHQDVRLGKLAQRNRQGPDMVVVAMSEDDGLGLLFANQVVLRQALPAFAFGVCAGVHEQAVAFHFEKPSAGADVRSRIEIDDSHGMPGNE